ncbi:hypothetical protein [Roseinatronobacter bogoriensis]|uniref:hypothetical protein n=1 Tax=Roseinatronobacter bogoriensis TaxID=119542 RepID=UPI0010641523|nr:hypothetical protein [Rhodobaca]MBB4209323.1 hypothetical protein [Rhodobaca bogoriensis DSM 18756]TDW34343.1 hypothetical protein LY39_03398 [Rhodobaca barguzinensis]TDY67066.1 hypothetical protein EV660_10867 [Rhodobaca bogoriensis DSM 18756]
MKNSEVLAKLITAAQSANDPLDELACRRAAAWIRWCDGYGATLTRPEADRIAAGGALGEAARGLIRRLAEEYPAPIEDIQFLSLHDDDGTPWSLSEVAICADRSDKTKDHRERGLRSRGGYPLSL